MTRTGIVWIALCVAACASKAQRADDKQAPEPLAAHSPAAEVAKPTGFIGVLTPRDIAEVTAPFTTNVNEFLVKLGEEVEKGQKLALLDEKPLLEQLAVARAELKASQAEVAQASVSASAAVSQLKREQKGAREGISSKADVADASYKASEAGTLVAQARARVEQQKAKISAMESKLKDMTLIAPISGRVSLRYVEPGGRIEEGRPIVRVISSGELFVKFAVPNELAGKIGPGDVVDVLIEARGMKAKAKVKSVAPELDPIAQMILAEAELTGELPDKLQSGMVCRVQLAMK